MDVDSPIYTPASPFYTPSSPPLAGASVDSPIYTPHSPVIDPITVVSPSQDPNPSENLQGERSESPLADALTQPPMEENPEQPVAAAVREDPDQPEAVNAQEAPVPPNPFAITDEPSTVTQSEAQQFYHRYDIPEGIEILIPNQN